MTVHIRTALTHTSENILVNGGHLVLGTWQGIYIWEHLQRNHVRELLVHISQLTLIICYQAYILYF
ncbi:MAG TPA: YjbQ family protein [Leptolyngbyaceae cyanobacterium]